MTRLILCGALAVLMLAHASATPPGPIQTVFLILMENKNWAEIKGHPQAPYINTQLLPRASHTEQYYSPGVSPSLPNYLWLEAGDAFGITDDAPPHVHHQRTTAHLVTRLAQAGLSWTSYQEDISGTECPLTATGLYRPKHNPMVYFDDVTDSNNPRSSHCIAHVRPYHELAQDLARNTVAHYNFITPNLCHDMHDCDLRTGDTWLAEEVPKILASQAYQSGGALFITWDEGSAGIFSLWQRRRGPIGMIVLSPYAKGHGYANTLPYTHSSTLRTIQRILGVTPFLADAVHATDLSDLFAIPLPATAPADQHSRDP
jgi:phosphatidylinositol-3-phosphatase